MCSSPYFIPRKHLCKASHNLESKLASIEEYFSQTKHGYTVNGKHFDSLGEAQMYVKQFPYMDNGWITPE